MTFDLRKQLRHVTVAVVWLCVGRVVGSLSPLVSNPVLLEGTIVLWPRRLSQTSCNTIARTTCQRLDKTIHINTSIYSVPGGDYKYTMPCVGVFVYVRAPASQVKKKCSLSRNGRDVCVESTISALSFSLNTLGRAQMLGEGVDILRVYDHN